MNPNNQKFLFTSARLGFRFLDKSDFVDHLRLDSDPEVRASFPDGVMTDEQVAKNIAYNQSMFEQHGFCSFVVILLETNKFVGRCGFTLLLEGELEAGEIGVGYLFFKEFWGRGLATEALVAVLNWADKNILNIDNVVGFTHISHLASQKVMQKAGMRFYKEQIARKSRCVFYKKVLREDQKKGFCKDSVIRK